MVTHVYTWLAEEIRQINKKSINPCAFRRDRKHYSHFANQYRSKYNFYFTTVRKIYFISYVITVDVLEKSNEITVYGMMFDKNESCYALLKCFTICVCSMRDTSSYFFLINELGQ